MLEFEVSEKLKEAKTAMQQVIYRYGRILEQTELLPMSPFFTPLVGFLGSKRWVITPAYTPRMQELGTIQSMNSSLLMVLGLEN